MVLNGCCFECRGSAGERSEAATRTRSCSTGYFAHRLEGVSYMSIGAQVGEPIQSVSGLSQFPTKTVDGCDHLLEVGLQLQQFGLILFGSSICPPQRHDGA